MKQVRKMVRLWQNCALTKTMPKPIMVRGHCGAWVNVRLWCTNVVDDSSRQGYLTLQYDAILVIIMLLLFNGAPFQTSLQIRFIFILFANPAFPICLSVCSVCLPTCRQISFTLFFPLHDFACCLLSFPAFTYILMYTYFSLVVLFFHPPINI